MISIFSVQDKEDLTLLSSDTVRSAPAPEDPKAAELVSDLNKVNRGLEQCEKEILGRIRVPLDNRNPTQDLEKRLSEHEVRNLGTPREMKEFMHIWC